ncbi:MULTISPECIES: tyrosine-type recombinase/integrase [unclassified Streptomyces]|uniref:tyrosine-type recombinase/integrase n=1 Tax=Streptomyces sp. NPDC055082 TaxID=3365718 RepID=UPI0037CDCE35
MTTRIYPHTVSADTRHTPATQAINRGMSLEAIAALLGHRSLSMTRCLRADRRPHRRRRVLHRLGEGRGALRRPAPAAHRAADGMPMALSASTVGWTDAVTGEEPLHAGYREPAARTYCCRDRSGARPGGGDGQGFGPPGSEGGAARP